MIGDKLIPHAIGNCRDGKRTARRIDQAGRRESPGPGVILQRIVNLIRHRLGRIQQQIQPPAIGPIGLELAGIGQDCIHQQIQAPAVGPVGLELAGIAENGRDISSDCCQCPVIGNRIGNSLDRIDQQIQAPAIGPIGLKLAGIGEDCIDQQVQPPAIGPIGLKLTGIGKDRRQVAQRPAIRQQIRHRLDRIHHGIDRGDIRRILRRALGFQGIFADERIAACDLHRHDHPIGPAGERRIGNVESVNAFCVGCIDLFEPAVAVRGIDRGQRGRRDQRSRTALPPVSGRHVAEHLARNFGIVRCGAQQNRNAYIRARRLDSACQFIAH